jgi:hypothetical protein
MSPWFETHFHLQRVASTMQLSTDAKKPVPRADFFADPIFSICSVNSARKYAEIRLAPIDPAPLLAGKLCLFHRHGNKGVELCSVSRQTPWRTIRSLPSPQGSINTRSGFDDGSLQQVI